MCEGFSHGGEPGSRERRSLRPNLQMVPTDGRRARMGLPHTTNSHALRCSERPVLKLCADIIFVGLVTGLIMSQPQRVQGEEYDSRIYKLCAPWRGVRGDAYLRVFRPKFNNGLIGSIDKYSSTVGSQGWTRPGRKCCWCAWARGQRSSDP